MRRAISTEILGLALFIVAVCFAHIGQGTLGLDGIRYAQIAKHILTSGDWYRLYDSYTEAPYCNKPPLLFWLTATSFYLFGYTTAAAKLFCTAFAAVAVALLWFAASSLWGRAAGWLAITFLVGSPIFFRAVVDLNFEAMVLTGGLMVATALLSSLRAGELSMRLTLLAAAGVMLLLQAKPPYIVLTIAPFVFTAQRVPEWRAKRTLAILCCGLLLGITWLPFVNEEGYVATSARNQLVEPFLLDVSVAKNLWRWLQLLVAHFGPAMFSGLWAVTRILRRREVALTDETILLLLWAAPIVAIVPLAAVRLRYVLIPSLGLILLAARELSRMVPGRVVASFPRIAAFIGASVIALAVIPVVPMHVPDPFVTHFRLHPDQLSAVPPLCVQDGAPGDVAAPTQRRLELLLNFEFGIEARAYGSATLPHEVVASSSQLLAEERCLAELSQQFGKIRVIESFPEGIWRVALS